MSPFRERPTLIVEAGLVYRDAPPYITPEGAILEGEPLLWDVADPGGPRVPKSGDASQGEAKTRRPTLVPPKARPGTQLHPKQGRNLVIGERAALQRCGSAPSLPLSFLRGWFRSVTL